MHQLLKSICKAFATGVIACLLMSILSAQAATSATLLTSNGNNISIKSVEPFHFFYTRIQTEKHSLADKIKSKTMDMSIKLARGSSAKINGPFLLSYHSSEQRNTQQIAADIGFPVSKRTKRLPPYKYRKAKAFDCASKTFTGPPAQLEQEWRLLYQFTREQQLSLNGESRMLLLSSEADGQIKVELQLGITKGQAEQEKENRLDNGSITARL